MYWGGGLIDIHTHSKFSFDGCEEPMDMARRAAELGVEHFALTDHIEMDRYGVCEWDFDAVIERSKPVFEELGVAFDGKMRVYYGAELGQALYNREAAEKILSVRDYDFVIGSVHRTRHCERVGSCPDTEEGRKRVIAEYFEEMLSLAEWGKFSTLAHMTFLLRFVGVDTPGGLVDDKTKRTQAAFEVHGAVIDKILETLIKNGIALEVNASGYRHGLGEPMPGAPFIKRYRELGGRLITVGSDAHAVGDVGRDIPRCCGLLRELGFSEVCVFEKMEPRFISI